MCFTAYHGAQVKYVILLHRLLQYTAAAHAFVSSRPSWFILDVISDLNHMVLFGFISKTKRT